MIFLLLLRRLGVRTRLVVGGLTVITGLALSTASLAVPGVLVHGAATTVLGAAVIVSAARQGRRTVEPAGDAVPNRDAVR